MLGFAALTGSVYTQLGSRPEARYHIFRSHLDTAPPVACPGAFRCDAVTRRRAAPPVTVRLPNQFRLRTIPRRSQSLPIDTELLRAHILVHLQPVVEHVSHLVGDRHAKPMFLPRLVPRDD